MRTILPVAALAAALFVTPAVSVEVIDKCFTPAEAMSLMEKNGYDPVGVLPYEDGKAVIYLIGSFGAFAAPIDDKGCVSPVGIPFPDYKAAIQA